MDILIENNNNFFSGFKIELKCITISDKGGGGKWSLSTVGYLNCLSNIKVFL